MKLEEPLYVVVEKPKLMFFFKGIVNKRNSNTSKLRNKMINKLTSKRQHVQSQIFTKNSMRSTDMYHNAY